MPVLKPGPIKLIRDSARTYRAEGPKSQLKKLAKVIPGMDYNGLYFVVPLNAAGALAKLYTGDVRPPEDPLPGIEIESPAAMSKLHPYQVDGVYTAAQHNAWMFNDEMGLGKSVQALLSLGPIGPVLIVCPAIVRRVWLDEVTKWLGAEQSVELIEPGWKDEDKRARFTICSYRMAKQLKPRSWAALICDEAHFLKNCETERSRAVRKHLDHMTDEARRYFLTGTPIANEPGDLHGQLDALEPYCWGSVYEFRARYQKTRPNANAYSGKEYYGLNPDNAAELAERLSRISLRRTKAEVKHLLPPLTVTGVPVKPAKLDIYKMLDDFARGDKHNLRVPSNVIQACSDAKLTHTIEMVDSIRDGGASHIAVLTHFRATAERLAKALGGTLITGADTTKARHKKLAKLNDSSVGILVATMHSLTTGLSLTKFSEVVYAELDWRPDEVSQSMARYHRVSGRQPVHIRVLILQGTLEEKVARSVLRKAKDIDLAIGAGEVESGLIESLDAQGDDARFLREMRLAAASMVKADAYG